MYVLHICMYLVNKLNYIDVAQMMMLIKVNAQLIVISDTM